MTIERSALRSIALATLPLALLGVTPRARASTNLLNVYVGAAYGRADLKAQAPDLIPSSPVSLGSFDRSGSAYQFIAGVRGLYVLGAEFDYFNLGSGTASTGWSGVGTVSGRMSQKGEAAFAVLYLPVPVIDVYLKAGVGRITSDLSASYTPQLLCVVSGCPPITGSRSATTTSVAAGAGVQFKLGSWAIRGEYERFTALGDHPSLASVGVTWSFM